MKFTLYASRHSSGDTNIEFTLFASLHSSGDTNTEFTMYANGHSSGDTNTEFTLYASRHSSGDTNTEFTLYATLSTKLLVHSTVICSTLTEDTHLEIRTWSSLTSFINQRYKSRVPFPTL